MRDPYHPTHVLAPHDDATWRKAILLSQHLRRGEWRVTVAYAVDGLTFWRGMPAGECRPVDNRPSASVVPRSPFPRPPDFQGSKYALPTRGRNCAAASYAGSLLVGA